MTDLLRSPDRAAFVPPNPDYSAVAALIMDLQSVGLRLETTLETARKGGAGPSDSGMLWIEGVPVTVP
ncbi:MAG: hypothetical protein QOG20_223, partial [Pseudonocardiales bacterium]|nr:hypothetical protein [Pseudonocardiales bacterium]